MGGGSEGGCVWVVATVKNGRYHRPIFRIRQFLCVVLFSLFLRVSWKMQNKTKIKKKENKQKGGVCGKRQEVCVCVYVRFASSSFFRIFNRHDRCALLFDVPRDGVGGGRASASKRQQGAVQLDFPSL